MPIDIARVIGAVTREVTSRELDGAPARVLVMTRAYATDKADLWDALTNPERLPRWFLPVSGEFRLGGRYQIEGNASGEIVRCEPPRRLGLTWGMHGQTSWVNVDLVDDPAGGTELRLEHVWHESEDDMWEEYGPGAGGVGWDGALLGLDQHLASEASLTPETAMEWMASDEGRAFYRASSDAWCEASIASGTGREAALAAAERTRRFYTGEAEPDAEA